MAEQITQQGRALKVFTPLDFDVLLIEKLSASEWISRPFRFTVKLLANVLTGMNQKVTADKLVGKAMAIELELASGKTRYFSGIVESFTKEGQDDQFVYYRAEMVPWFWLLDLKADCRIFQDQTVLQVIQKIVSELGFDKYFRSDLTKTYTKWDYCVQYRETDFAFLSRLMEEEGISYYFEHTSDHTHILVLTDTPEGPKDCPQESSFRFDPEVGVSEAEDAIRSWEISQKLSSGKWVLRDYHFEMPRNTLEVPEDSLHVIDENKNLDVFDYPGDYAKKFNEPASRLGQVRPEGEKLVRLQMEQDEASHIVYDATSYCRAMTSGYKFTVTGAGQVPVGPYLLTTVQHNVVQHPAYMGGVEVAAFYDNSFSCIPASVPFHPPRDTPKPIVYGPQTARVIDESESGSTEEIWPDKYGRVRVRFPWDREAKYACWIRVAQPWAGNMWGHQWIPRIGDEVVVTFLEGDPDCPLIVGSVYNSDNMPPFKLPDNKTQSGILTHSSKQGSSANYNMFRFEDKKGSEDVLLHAENTMHNSVEASQFITVGVNRNITTGGMKDGNKIGDVKEKVFNNHNLHVLGNARVKIEGTEDVEVDDSSTTMFGKDRTVEVETDDVLMANTITLQATETLTLVAGANSIVMGPSGITIIGLPMLNLNPMVAIPPIPKPPAMVMNPDDPDS